MFLGSGERSEWGASGRPKFFYGWVMLAVSVLGLWATSPGQTFVVSAFNDSWKEDLGVSTWSLSLTYTIGSLLAGVLIIGVGGVSDRFGPRRSMGVIGAGLGIGCLITSQAQGLITLGVGFFLIRLLGQGALSLVSGHAIALWFERRLGTVEGIRAALMACALGGAPIVALALIEGLGWRWAYVVLGAGVWVMVLPAAALIARDHPEEVGQRIDNAPAEEKAGSGDEAEEDQKSSADHDPGFTLWEAVQTLAFWTILALLSAQAFLVTAVVFHRIEIFAEMGMGEEQAAAVMVSFAVVMGTMVLINGYLTDYLPPWLLLAVGAVMLGLGCGLLSITGGPIMAHVSMGVLALGQAISNASGKPTAARFFGRAHHGAIRGAIMTAMVLGASAAPIILVLGKQWLGGFSPALLGLGVACVPLVIGGLVTRRPAPVDGKAAGLAGPKAAVEG